MYKNSNPEPQSPKRQTRRSIR